MAQRVRQYDNFQQGSLTPTDWAPQPGPQLAALEADWCFELLFGGARGGGKSIVLLLDYLQDVPKYGAAWNGIIIRHTYKQLEQLIRDSYKMFPQTGAVFEKQPKTWHWPNGAKLMFRNLERVEDTADYQGASFQFLGIDEAGNYPDPEVYYRMLATLRSGDVEVPTIRARLTANPGGPGHHWLKERFIDPAPAGYQPIKTLDTTKGARERMFIPSKVRDNRKLMEADPYYIENLKMQGSPELVRAWLDGDWSVMIGAFFSEFSMKKHVIEPFNIPSHWYRYRGFDWGSAEPFCVLWAAVADGNPVQLRDGSYMPLQRGTLVIYREWYGMEPGKNNTGIRMRNEAIAQGILRRTGDERCTLTVTDSLPFQDRGGISIAETFRKEGVMLTQADTSRIPGWQQVRSRLVGTAQGPLILIFNTCTHLIRTLPALQCDKHNFEDTDDKFENHAPDACRYLCMERPIVRKRANVQKLRSVNEMTFNELLEHDRIHRDD